MRRYGGGGGRGLRVRALPPFPAPFLSRRPSAAPGAAGWLQTLNATLNGKKG